MCEQVKTETANGFENIFADFGYEAAKNYVRLKKSSSESISVAKWKFPNSVAMPCNELVGTRKARSVNCFVRALSMNAATTGTSPSTSANPSFEKSQK